MHAILSVCRECMPLHFDIYFLFSFFSRSFSQYVEIGDEVLALCEAQNRLLPARVISVHKEQLKGVYLFYVKLFVCSPCFVLGFVSKWYY